jgi:ABC-type bacteriocin/lantibiotic exporter with double-glycine peptidase domain
MINCPYCISEIADEAVVCKVCTKDIYLFKPMMARIAELESKLLESSPSENYELRIEALEAQLTGHEARKHSNRGLKALFLDAIIYILLPLAILLASHYLITIVYDAKMLYLRIISMLIPLPFGYFLFKSIRRQIFSWVISVFILAISAVIGMSWITSLIDHSPILPQSNFEWREMLEYAASISFSFLTGMLLGKIAYSNKHINKSTHIGPFTKFVLSLLGEEKLSPEGIHELMKKINEYSGTIIALGTTALSIYTGLKHVL